MESDYWENPELNRFDPALLDEEEYEALSKGECQTAEASMSKIAMYPDGWEDSDNETINSEGIVVGSPTFDELYDAGLYGGMKRSNLGPSQGTGLDPEEERNFRREDRRAARTRPMEAITQNLEEFVKTIPLLLAEELETEEEKEICRLKEMRRRRRVSPGKSCRKPTNLAMSEVEKESLRRTQSERVGAWLQSNK